MNSPGWTREIDTPIQTIAASTRLGLVAVGGVGGVELYGLRDGAPTEVLEDRNMTQSLAFHPEQPLLLIANASGWIAGYDVQRRQNRFTPFEAAATPWAVAFSRNGATFVVACIAADAQMRHVARRYDVELGMPVAQPMLHTKDVTSVTSTAGGLFVTGDANGIVSAWPAGLERRTAAEALAAIAANTGETIDEESGAIHVAAPADSSPAAHLH